MTIDELKDLAEAARKYDCSHHLPANCPYYNFKAAATPERILALIELFKGLQVAYDRLRAMYVGEVYLDEERGNDE